MQPIDCPHWKPSSSLHAGRCAIKAYLKPSFTVCHERCTKRPPGSAANDTLEHYTVTPVTVSAKPASATITPIPFDRWPKWAVWVSERRTADDANVGDTIERLLGTFGKAYKATLLAVGLPCGCATRKKEYSVSMPFDSLEGRPCRL